MKKQIITKVLFACLIVAMSGFTMNLQAQAEIVVEFTNPNDLDIGSSNDGYFGIGLGGSGSGATAEGEPFEVDDPYVEFAFTIGATGQIGLDVITPTTYQPVVDALNAWDNPAIGAATDPALFGKSFSLILTAESRMQLGVGESGNLGGIGVRGKNQRRIDDEGENNEWMEFELTGDVGIDFVRFGYNDVSGEENAHAVVIDHNSRGYHEITDGVDGPPPLDLYIDGTDYNMRYFSDFLRFTTEDSIHVGYKLFSLEFNIVAAEDKPPAVIKTTPPNADSTINTVADDYIIEWDATMDQPATEAAVSISPVDGTDPAVANVQFVWGAGTMGDMQTISFDDLEFDTWYQVVVGTGALGTNGLNKEVAETFTFKTLPEPPKVISSFPENLAMEVPINTPMSIEFSKPMIDTTVEKAISFIPELMINSFVWSGDMTTVFIATDEMVPSTMYYVTVEVDATDQFNNQMTDPHIWAFTTAIATSVGDNRANDVAFYPNPVDGIMMISGMDVATVEIYSITGQKVREIANTSVINLKDVASGSYVVVATDREDYKVRRMIVIE